MIKEERILQLEEDLKNPVLGDAGKAKIQKEIELLKTPPPPPPKPKRGNPAFQKGKTAPYKKTPKRTFSEEEKEEIIENYQRHRAREKERAHKTFPLHYEE